MGQQSCDQSVFGNPLNYYNGSSYSFTWKNGRQLATATKGSNSLSFDYNDEGIRTKKVVNGVEHTYYLSGSQITAEEWGSNLCVYLYDADGAPIGMQYRTTSMAKGDFYTFWFEKNLQGDIVAVYNESGTKVYTYQYDAWGNCTATPVSSIGANIYAQYNPFRYRGYYYDMETGLYYLQSRYYDPAVGRFINADGQLNPGVLGSNMYAYCNNNPIMGTDETGRGWLGALVGGLCGAIVGGAFGALSAITSGGDIGAGIAIGAINGGICGAIGGSIAEDVATGGISSVGTATMLLAIDACFITGVASDIASQCINSQPQSISEIDGYSALRAGVQNVVITTLSITPAALGSVGIAGDIVLGSIYNLLSSTGQWIYNTVEDSIRQREKGVRNPTKEVIPIG